VIERSGVDDSDVAEMKRFTIWRMRHEWFLDNVGIVHDVREWSGKTYLVVQSPESPINIIRLHGHEIHESVTCCYEWGSRDVIRRGLRKGNGLTTTINFKLGSNHRDLDCITLPFIIFLKTETRTLPPAGPRSFLKLSKVASLVTT